MVGMARIRWCIRRLYAGGNGCFYISPNSGFDAACEAAREALSRGHVPGDAEVDMLARRVAAGEAPGGAADLAVYDSFVRDGVA